MRQVWAMMAGVAGLLWTGVASAHPMDALSGAEITQVVSVLKQGGKVDDQTLYSAITLKEPPKAAIMAWQPGQTLPRQASVVARRAEHTYQGVVDLTAGKVVGWAEVPGAQGAVLLADWAAAQEITISDPAWQAAMRKRGYTKFDQMFCAPMTYGYFGTTQEAGPRLMRVPCFDTVGTRNNLYGRPIEGVTAIVDLGQKRVIKVIDTGTVPLSDNVHAFDEAGAAPLRPALRAVESKVSDGGNIKLADSLVQWDRWSFHVRMDRRLGPVLSLVKVQDGARQRSVLYQANVSEMFVPYMDPDPSWGARTFMDVGEYGFGLLATTLVPGMDCPKDAVFLNATMPDDTGAPSEAKSVLCLFERATASPLWRHAEMINGTYEARPEVEMVVRAVPTVGNYDYVVDWVFNQKGEIRIDVGATGIDEVKGVRARTMQDPTAVADTAHGTLVAPNLVATWHDHYLSFRLDFDIDGARNSFLREHLVAKQAEAGNPRRSFWVVEPIPMPKEGAIRPMHTGGPEQWRVINPTARNGLGQNPGYEIMAGHSATSLLDPKDWPQQRASFTDATMWVSAYDPDQLFAAGAFPNQSHGGDGLPDYVKPGRSIQNTDLVVWYTLGFHHVTRPEDWPILPTKWHGFMLRPFSFFDRSPALDTPKSFAPPQ